MNKLTTWKDGKIGFWEQKQRNDWEISDPANYPPHWKHCLQHIKLIENKIGEIYDLGCGVGIYAQLIHIYFPQLLYTGYDFSQVAIDIANEYYLNKNSRFYCEDINNLIEIKYADQNKQKSLTIANALCDVCINGDLILEHILSMKSQYVSLQRVKVTDENSYAKKYQAYSDIESYEFFHNEFKLLNTIKEYHYNILQQNRWEAVQFPIYDILLEYVDN